MLTFEDTFFREEERDGFLVSEMMKRAWAAEMDVLVQVTDICERHGIVYYADYGTMLGAVRHGGFVPWDDDIDIALKRPDYMRLMGLLQKELPKDYYVGSVYANPNHGQPWTSVMNGRFVTRDDARTNRFFGCPFICGIDIYPLDYLPREKELEQTQILLYNVVYDAAQRYEELKASGELKKYLPQIEELCRMSFTDLEPVRGQLWKLADRIAMMFGADESDELTLLPRIVMGDNNFRLKKEWYADVVRMPFETISVNVACGYEEILTKMYGDWRVPVREMGAHDYPFYKKQMEALGMVD